MVALRTAFILTRLTHNPKYYYLSLTLQITQKSDIIHQCASDGDVSSSVRLHSLPLTQSPLLTTPLEFV
jgi:hypothetical protein